MPRSRLLAIPLVALCLIGAATLQMMSPEATGPQGPAWSFFLIGTPLALTVLVWMGWSWTAMACVVYGTIGLALDVATMTSILGGKGGSNGLLFLSWLSGLLNLSLIVGGGRAFVRSLLGPLPPGSRPPSPPSPSSSSAP